MTAYYLFISPRGGGGTHCRVVIAVHHPGICFKPIFSSNVELYHSSSTGLTQNDCLCLKAAC